MARMFSRSDRCREGYVVFEAFKGFRLRRALGLTALAGLLLVGVTASPAAAATVTLAKQFSNVFGGNGYAPVKIYDATYYKNGLSVYAGGFALKGDLDGNGSVESFTAFCLDIAHELHLPSAYSVTDTPFTGALLSAVQKTNILKLFDTAYSTISLSSKAQSAGFQLALWEIVNETGTSLKLDSGSFKAGYYNAQSPAAIAAGQGFLDGLNGPVTGHYHLSFLQSEDKCNPSQNLVTAAPVPVPAAGVMMLTVLGGFGVAARRKRRRAA